MKSHKEIEGRRNIQKGELKIKILSLQNFMMIFNPMLEMIIRLNEHLTNPCLLSLSKSPAPRNTETSLLHKLPRAVVKISNSTHQGLFLFCTGHTEAQEA